MLHNILKRKYGRPVAAGLLLGLFIASLVAGTPRVHRYDYADYAVQKDETLFSLLARGGHEPDSIAYLVSERIVSKRGSDRLLANSGPAARDGDHLTVVGNTLVISHPGGTFEYYELSSPADLRLRKVQAVFYIFGITVFALLALLCIWRKPSNTNPVLSALNRRGAAAARLAGRLGRRRFWFVVLVTSLIVLITILWSAVLYSDIWSLLALFAMLVVFALTASLIIAGTAWLVTQAAHLLAAGTTIRLPWFWVPLCMACISCCAAAYLLSLMLAGIAAP